LRFDWQLTELACNLIALYTEFVITATSFPMSFPAQALFIATNNPGKLAELKELLSGVPLELLSLADFTAVAKVEETGLTYDENARLKASGYALQSGLPAIADDSGLEVEALDNRPGVFSARYGGTETSFAKKMALLLAELDKTGDEERRARFVCSMAIADANGEIIFTSKGICDGQIASEPRGKGGFGYDPLFIPAGFDRTFGELPEAIKRKISHRACAFAQIIPFLRDFRVI
jgi:XTP/dITP diphosphohydrolase